MHDLAFCMRNATSRLLTFFLIIEHCHVNLFCQFYYEQTYNTASIQFGQQIVLTQHTIIDFGPGFSIAKLGYCQSDSVIPVCIWLSFN